MMCYTEDSKCFKVLKMAHRIKGWQSFKNLCDKSPNIFLVILGISLILLLWAGGVQFGVMEWGAL